MPLDFSTFESTIQTKMDTLSEPKELFLLAKTIESTIDNQTVSDITNAGDAELADIATAGDSELAQIATAGDAELAAIGTAGDAELADIASAGDSYLSQIATAGDSELAQIGTAGDSELAQIGTAGDAELADIASAGDAELADISSAGTAQLNLINNALDGATISNAYIEGQTTANLVTITSSGGNATVDVSTAYYFKTTITENTVFSFTNVATGKVNSITIFIVNGGNYTVTWPANVNWSNGLAPTLTASGGDILTFFIEDDTNWKAFRNASNVTF